MSTPTQAQAPNHIWITAAVKAVESNDGVMRVRILGGPHGEDRQRQVFDAETDFGRAKHVGLVYYHGYRDADKPAVTYVGEATKAERDEAGQWYVGELDDTPLGRRIYSDALAGKARASSDAMGHLVRPMGILGKPGRVSSWPIGAISLMDASTAHYAINPGAVVNAAKSFYDELLSASIADSGESAAKAGATFARRNRERIVELRRLIDELQSEMPDAFEQGAPDTPGAPHTAPDAGGDGGIGAKAYKMDKELLDKIGEVVDLRFTAAAKADEERKRVEAEAASEKGKQEAAVKAAVDAQLDAKLKEMDEAAVKAGRPRFFAAGASGNGANSADKDTNAAKAEAAKADKEAFEAYYRFGKRDWTDTPAAKAALNEGTASQGGYLVPTLYNNELVQTIKELSYLRAAGARQLSIQGTNAFKTPTLSNTTKAVLTAEAATFDEVEPTLGEVTHTPYKYTRLVKASDEVLADSRIDVFGQVVGPDAANAFVLAENDAFTTGTGSSQPQGVVTGASAGVTAAGVAAITPDELINLYHSLSYVYRPRAVWMMNDSTLAYIRKLKDTTNQYLIQPGLNGDPVGALMGRPIITNNNMAALATGNKTVLFGDMSYFWVVDFASLEFRRLDELYAANGQVGFRWYRRFDSHVMLSAAIKYLVQA